MMTLLDLSAAFDTVDHRRTQDFTMEVVHRGWIKNFLKGVRAKEFGGRSLWAKPWKRGTGVHSPQKFKQNVKFVMARYTLVMVFL